MRKKKDKINKENKRRSRREGERSRFSFHDARLATKLCIISGVVLFICMMATDMVSMSRVKAAMRTAQDGTMAFMDAYVDANGTLLYSAAYPIMYNRQFYGVVLMDITADIFVSLDETIAAYPSMYVDLVRNQSGILYSTRADTISQSLSEMMSANAYDLLKAGMTNGDQFQSSQFCIETKESDGKYVRYASPHPGGQ